MPKTSATTAERQDNKKLGWRRRPERKPRRVTLKLLRAALDKTQVEVAMAADMSQGEVSRLEGQADFKLSTAQRYLAALGLELELAAIAKDGRRFVLSITPSSSEADE